MIGSDTKLQQLSAKSPPIDRKALLYRQPPIIASIHHDQFLAQRTVSHAREHACGDTFRLAVAGDYTKAVLSGGILPNNSRQ